MRLVRSVAPSALGAILLLAARPVWSDVTERASLDSTGALANAINIERFCPTLAADGRFVAFGSDATNLVTGDTNAVSDAFVYDRVTGTTERVSVSSAGAEANGASFAPAISADGRFVAFPSEATNLVPGDTNGVTDVFVRDRLTGTTERVSVSSAGAEANGTSFTPAISADGRFVAFSSDATNLVGRDTNGAVDVFVHDRVTGATKRVSVSSTGAQANDDSFAGFFAPAVSADGRFVAFSSDATNLVPGDTNDQTDVFVRDRCLTNGVSVAGCTAKTQRVSVSSSGAQGSGRSLSPVVSADGRFVAFASEADDLVVGDTNHAFDVFVNDRMTGMTERVSVDSTGAQANAASIEQFCPALSGDGRFVAFESDATNLVPGDTNGVADVFVRDRLTATTERVSVDSAGAQANDRSDFPAISADVSVVTFVSTATNLVPDDTNVCGSFMTPGSCPDLFVRVRTITATPGPPTTGTTPPCTSSGCPVDPTPTGAACAGEAIPARVTTLLERAASLVDQAATSPAKKARKLLVKARKALKQAKARATRAARSKRPTLSAGCAAALRDAADRLAAQP